MLSPALQTVWTRIRQTLNFVTTAPDIPCAVVVPATARWHVNWSHFHAHMALRQIINQDMLRWLDGKETLLREHLLFSIDKLVPPALPHAGYILSVSHEDWVQLSCALVTLEITQAHRPDVSLLPGTMPRTLLDHLQALRLADRTPAHA